MIRAFQSPRVWQDSGVGLTPQQFEQVQYRLRRGGRGTAAIGLATPHWLGTGSVIIGIDPSLRGTGYGVIRLARTIPAALAYGTIECPARWERSRCLVKIAQVLREVMAQQQPGVAVIEGLFFAQNLQTALLMGEARGVCMLAAAEAGLELYEIAPRKVKQAIVGYGAAQKLAVAKMVQRLLRLEAMPAPDAADALALALALAQQTGRFALSLPRKI